MDDIEMHSEEALRRSFWANHSHLIEVKGQRQNDYPADTRMAFCDYVETLANYGDISEALAQRATL